MSSPANRWTGRNRPGWVNPEYDHLYGVLTNTLDANKRIPLIVQMIKLITDELPAMTLYYRPMVVAYSADIQGPQRIAPGGGSTANIHLWAWQR
jgi:ABC-type transport system substrate-binding protein